MYAFIIDQLIIVSVLDKFLAVLLLKNKKITPEVSISIILTNRLNNNLFSKKWKIV